jgi:FG-GAP-like repeat/Secretion system C-terminal sorting domain
MSASSTTSGIPPILFAEPPTLDSLPPLPAGPKLPDSLTAGMNSFVTGDLDGDGLPDFIGVESADSVLDVRRNLGGGAYAAAVKYALATGAYKVVLGDFNGDGHEDVAIDNLSDSFAHQFSVLLNLGAGSLGARRDGDFPVPSVALDLFAVDLGHVGRDDLVFSPFHPACAFVARSQADGAFAPLETIQPFSNIDVYEETNVTVGDLDGDGNPDILLFTRHGDCYTRECQVLCIFYGRNDGSFEDAIEYQAFDPTLGGGEVGIVLQDVDGDGRLDALLFDNVYPHTAGSIKAALIRNSGHRQMEAPFVREIGRTAWTLMAGQVEPGGPTDLMASDDVTTTLIRNRGDGTFSSEESLGSGSLMAVADLNGDGLSDVITADSSGIGVRIANSTGGFLSPHVLTAGTFLALADFTGDHRKDLAVLMPNGDIGVLSGDGSGGFGPPQDFGTAAGISFPLAAVDLDGDGLADLATVGLYWPPATDFESEPSDSLLVRWNNGHGFSAPSSYDFGSASPSEHYYAYPMDLQAGDFNGDGLPDLAVVNGDGEGGSGGFVRMVPNLGHRTFGVPSPGEDAGEDSYGGVVGDFDGDGLDDLVVVAANTDDTGMFYAFRGLPDGTLASVPGPSTWGGYTADHYAFSIASGDFNGDGRADVAIGCVGAILAVPNITNIVHPTPTLASLISADPTPSGVTLIWDLGASSAQTAIERRTVSTGWIALATVNADGSGRVSYDDRSATPGSRVGYRLRVTNGARVTISAETWVNIPLTLALAIDTPRPNPTSGPLAISFSVPSAGHATLELMDVTGRRVRHREFEMPAATRQQVSFASDGALSPGLYFVRLTQNRKSVTSRVAVVR